MKSTCRMPISPLDTVNDVVARRPATLEVFRAWGIDTCCGGALTLDVVAQRHSLDLPGLLSDLARHAVPYPTHRPPRA